MKKQFIKPSLTEIFLLFLKIGAVGFGGGPAIISILRQEIVEKKGWIEEEDFLSGLALSMIPPGPMIINLSYFSGRLCRGFSGGVAAVLGMSIPSFVIIIILGILYIKNKSINFENGITGGLMPAVMGVVVALVVKMSHEHLKEKWEAAFMIVSAFLMFFLKIPPVVVILLSLAAGCIFLLFRKKEGAE